MKTLKNKIDDLVEKLESVINNMTDSDTCIVTIINGNEEVNIDISGLDILNEITLFKEWVATKLKSNFINIKILSIELKDCKVELIVATLLFLSSINLIHMKYCSLDENDNPVLLTDKKESPNYMPVYTIEKYEGHAQCEYLQE